MRLHWCKQDKSLLHQKSTYLRNMKITNIAYQALITHAKFHDHRSRGSVGDGKYKSPLRLRESCSNVPFSLLWFSKSREANRNNFHKNWFRKKDIMDQSVAKENKVKRSPKHKCEHCDKVYVRSQLLVDHVRSKHENIENQCQKCQKNFSSYETLMNHCRTVHRGFNYNCPHCPKQFTDRSSLYR